MKHRRPSLQGKLPKNIELLKQRAVRFKKGQVPWNKGKKYSVETCAKISAVQKGKIPWNKGLKTGHIPWNKGKTFAEICGDKHWNWKIDRSSLVKKQERNDSAYCDWRIHVWRRDNFKCKIANDNCEGKIQAHHILPWRDFPELRYQVNNGITLCHAHHPRKRAEEKRLAPVFQELVSVSNE